MNMKKVFTALLLLTGALLFHSCEDNREILIPYPADITFEEHTLGRFAYEIPAAPFKSGDSESGIVTVNVVKNSDGSFTGFALSNKNARHYPWPLSPDFAPAVPLTAEQIRAHIDTCIFSVYTAAPNKTKNFLVGCVNNDDAYITLEKPSVVEHVLVANTTYNYLLENYGSQYSGTLNAETQEYSLTGTKVRNIAIANTSVAMYGRFFLPGEDDINRIRLAGFEVLEKRKAGAAAGQAARLAGKTADVAAADSLAAAQAIHKGYVRLTVTGFNGTSQTGAVDFWMACRPDIDPANPLYSFVLGDWFRVDLASLGTVDKLLFNLSSDYVDGDGNNMTPPYFCLDGIRLRK
jgi:hypothetical protein